MGAVVCIAADISALEKQTILNTRANKIRDLAEKSNLEPGTCKRRLSLDDCGYLQKGNDFEKALSVGFGSIVHERIYFNRDAPSAPIIHDKKVMMINRISKPSHPPRLVSGARNNIHRESKIFKMKAELIKI